MDSWMNGAKASAVKRVIDNNFDILDKRTINIQSCVVSEFVASRWSFNDDLRRYTIIIPYADYNKKYPRVELYIKKDNGYLPVYGGYLIRDDGILLKSDVPYDGKVVIR